GGWVITIAFFGAYLVSITFSRWLLRTPLTLFGVIGLVALRPGELKQPRFSLAALLGLTLVVLALALSWARPVYGYDALSMWALKAKVAFFAKTWPATLFDPHTTHHTGYPPLVP